MYPHSATACSAGARRRTAATPSRWCTWRRRPSPAAVRTPSASRAARTGTTRSGAVCSESGLRFVIHWFYWWSYSVLLADLNHGGQSHRGQAICVGGYILRLYFSYLYFYHFQTNFPTPDNFLKEKLNNHSLPGTRVQNLRIYGRTC